MESSKKLSLGIDGGASSAKWSLLNEVGEIVMQGSTAPIDGHLYRQESLSRFQEFLVKLKEDLGSFVPTVVTLGITGFGDPSKIESELARFFPRAKLNLGTDIALGYRAEFALGEGVYLYAGTGSVAIHITKDGKEVTAGGWGYLLGDEGAGYWIGREALRHLMRQIESGVPFDSLSHHLEKELGEANWNTVREFVYGRNRSEVAALALIVGRCSEEGVDSAVEILDTAADYLSDLVNRMQVILKREDLSIAFGGGISGTGLSMKLRIEERLGKSISLSRNDHSITAANLGLIQ